MATVQVQFGGRAGAAFDLQTSEDLVAIRTCSKAPVDVVPLSGESRELLGDLEPVASFRDAGVEVFHVRNASIGSRDVIRARLKTEPAIRFAGRVLTDPVFTPEVTVAANVGAPMHEPVVYSENVFIKFAPGTKDSVVRQTLKAAGLTLKRPIEYVERGYFVAGVEGIGLDIFPVALKLLHDYEAVELCHPELIRPRGFRAAFPHQWHLKPATIAGAQIDAHASVVDAWKVSRGEGTTIAVIDDGVDLDHEEFASSKKIVAPRDVTPGVHDPGNPRPRTASDRHGTACAGVACANGTTGASGVAPRARLMPIRLMAGLGSQAEADAFAWAAGNGADVISCSWGPQDGEWNRPEDPAHRAVGRLSDNTRLAMEFALEQGRGGKGCVIVFAAGNGNESVDNDEYAAHPGVIAVAACNDSSVRSVYSDTGRALWCSFPSNDFSFKGVATLPVPPPHGGVWGPHQAPKTTGIWTVDRTGAAGYNGGHISSGDAAGNYTNNFGGTSSAAPGVAGVAALVLSVNKKLRHDEVRDILKRSCDRIDEAGGTYDVSGHSALYGYGRVNAAVAVTLAAPAAPKGAAGRKRSTVGTRSRAGRVASRPARQKRANRHK